MPADRDITSDNTCTVDLWINHGDTQEVITIYEIPETYELATHRPRRIVWTETWIFTLESLKWKYFFLSGVLKIWRLYSKTDYMRIHGVNRTVFFVRTEALPSFRAPLNETLSTAENLKSKALTKTLKTVWPRHLFNHWSPVVTFYISLDLTLKIPGSAHTLCACVTCGPQNSDYFPVQY